MKKTDPCLAVDGFDWSRDLRENKLGTGNADLIE